MDRRYHIIGACSCWGAQIRECEKGPEDLLHAGVFDKLKSQGANIEAVEMLYPTEKASKIDLPIEKTLPLINEFNGRLAGTVRKALSQRAFPLVVGGDHSIAAGTWSAFQIPFGLLWIDAHMDAHTPKTTPSGAYHGMPLASLLGHGKMAHNKFLHPSHVAIVGVRSFEEGEAEFVKQHQVKVYFIEEIRKRGLGAVLKEALQHVTRGEAHFGVSLDLDVFYLDEAPGVGSPVPGGVHKNEILPLLHQMSRNPKMLAFEMVEFNPDRDVGHRTRNTAFEVLWEIMRP